MPDTTPTRKFSFRPFADTTGRHGYFYLLEQEEQPLTQLEKTMLFAALSAVGFQVFVGNYYLLVMVPAVGSQVSADMNSRPSILASQTVMGTYLIPRPLSLFEQLPAGSATITEISADHHYNAIVIHLLPVYRLPGHGAVICLPDEPEVRGVLPTLEFPEQLCADITARCDSISGPCRPVRAEVSDRFLTVTLPDVTDEQFAKIVEAVIDSLLGGGQPPVLLVPTWHNFPGDVAG